MQTFETGSGTVEAREGTFLFFRTTAGDTAVFARHELADEATQAEMRQHGVPEGAEPEEVHEGVGIRFQGQRAFYSVVASISDVEAEIRSAGF